MNQRILFLLAAVATGAGAVEMSSDYVHSPSSKGFGAIDQVRLTLATDIGKTNVVGAYEYKTLEGTNGAAKVTGNFAELIVSHRWTDALYSQTRAGFTDEKRAFTDQAIYQEIGYKAASSSAGNMDLNLGVGTRKFETGRENFVNLGPTFSSATGAVWLRREQSLDSAGYRNSLSLAYYFTDKTRIDVGALNEHRTKFILPVTTGAVATSIKGKRYSVKATHQFVKNLDLSAGVEKVILERDGIDGKYYDPTSVSLGLRYKY